MEGGAGKTASERHCPWPKVLKGEPWGAGCVRTTGVGKALSSILATATALGRSSPARRALAALEITPPWGREYRSTRGPAADLPRLAGTGPITPWRIDGGKMETVTAFIFLGFKITVDVIAAMKLNDSWSLKERLWQNLNCVLKSRGVTYPTKAHIVKAVFFPVVR